MVRTYEIKGLLKTEELKDYVSKMVQKEDLQPGDPILSENKLAEKCKVSKVTVRRAISGLVDEGLLFRVQGKGTFIAKPRSGKKVKEIGAIFTEISTSFRSQILKGIDNVVKNNDYRLSIASSEGNSNQELEIIKNLREKGVDNFIIEPSPYDTNADYLRKIQKNGSALVFVDNFLRDTDTDYVVTDNTWGTYKGTSHLITLGYERIGYLGGIHGQAAVEDRFCGYKEALKKNGIRFDDRLIKETDCSEKSNYLAMKELLMMKDMPQAIFIVSNLYILGALKAINERGLIVPDDLFLLGFDFLQLSLSQLNDIDFSSFIKMPLPTIDQNSYRMGKMAAKILVKRIEKSSHGDNARPQQILLKPKLCFDKETI